jgi:hypothetical protein
VISTVSTPAGAGQADGGAGGASVLRGVGERRLKAIKRAMFGRANFDLLRRRVLLAT